MAPDSVEAQVVTIVAVLVAATLAALTWDRVRGWLAWLVRPVAVTLCVATAAAAAIVGVNRELELYSSWTELFGSAPDNGAGMPQQVVDAPVTAMGGRIVSFTVRGKASGLTLRAFAYLPPGYGTKLRGQRLPVIEALDGFPGSPQVWLKGLDAPRILDEEISARRMAPTVVVFPYQTVTPTRDTECVNAVGGVAMDTFLTTDVPAAVTRMFRVRTDGAGWGLMGYSAGGFCAVNLALRHPTRYAAAASLSGYFHALTDATTGDLYRGSAAARDQNSPLWRIHALPVPRLALYLAAARDDRFEYGELRRFVAQARPPLRLTTGTVPQGGHSRGVWRELERPAFDWLSSWLAGPEHAGSPPGRQPAGDHATPASPGQQPSRTSPNKQPPSPRERPPSPAPQSPVR